MSRTCPDMGDRERGASLVSALMLVAVMASMAMLLAGELRVSLRRSANMEVRDQAYWYALGARDLAGNVIASAMQTPETMLRPDARWLREARTFPIERGALSGRVRDGNNCFNINSLVVADGQGALIADDAQGARFERLLTALGLPAADAARLTAEATDWIDSDSRPRPGGGEDEIYAERVPAYRTGNTLMAEREEMLALASMTPAIFRQLAPLVCARPEPAALALNINTLTPDDWPLLVALFDGTLGRVGAEGILLARPAAGFADIESFWSLEAVRALETDAGLRSLIGVETRYFEVDVDVRHDGQSYRLEALYEWTGGTEPVRLSQRYGFIG